MIGMGEEEGTRHRTSDPWFGTTLECTGQRMLPSFKTLNPVFVVVTFRGPYKPARFSASCYRELS